MTTTPTTPVEPGQVWADNDPRCIGRTLRVDSVDDGSAVCTVLTNRDGAQKDLDRGRPRAVDQRGKTTRISVARFRPTSTGYRLVRHADGSPAGGEAL